MFIIGIVGLIDFNFYSLLFVQNFIYVLIKIFVGKCYERYQSYFYKRVREGNYREFLINVLVGMKVKSDMGGFYSGVGI